MHRFPAELFTKNLGVSLIGKHEHLKILALPRNGVSVSRQRKFPILTKSPELVIILANAVIFRERDPVGTIVIRRPEYPTIGVHRKRRSIGPLITLFVPGYFRRWSPTSRSRSAQRAIDFAEHPVKKLHRRGRAYAGPLERTGDDKEAAN